MSEPLTHFSSRLPQELVTVLIAMLPVSELRGAIPWALAQPPLGGGLSWPKAYFFAVVGNFLPVVPLLLGLGPLSQRLRKYQACDRCFQWLFTRTERRGRLVRQLEALGLVFFVAIPLPGTGAWTGSVAAFLFGIRLRTALSAIGLGICLAGGVVTMVSLGVISLWTLH